MTADRILVGICSCRANADKRRAVRESWLSKPVAGIEALFFVGEGDEEPFSEPDTVCLKAPDTYPELPSKVRAFFIHALEAYDFDWLFKCDDDTYVALDRLHDLAGPDRDLAGNEFLRKRQGFPSGGAGYLLSRRMVEALALDDSLPETGCEDVIMGRAAIRLGARTFPTHRLCFNSTRFPLRGNDVITSHWCSTEMLRSIHGNYQGLPVHELKATDGKTCHHIILRDNGFLEWLPRKGCGRWEKADGEGLHLQLPGHPPLVLASSGEGLSGSGMTFKAACPELPPTLVFSSVGDNARAVLTWFGGPAHVAIVHYGEKDDSPLIQTFRRRADHFASRKGGKFQNLLWWLDRNPGILDRYKRILVIDDDLELDQTDLASLLTEAASRDLPVCAPSQRAGGKISWKHMVRRPGSGVMLTNFVELGCVLFEKDALLRFLELYRPHAGRLTGWGTDFIISSACFDTRRPFGVIHGVSVFNPVRPPGEGIDACQPASERARNWREISSRFRIHDGSHVRIWSPGRQVPADLLDDESPGFGFLPDLVPGPRIEDRFPLRLFINLEKRQDRRTEVTRQFSSHNMEVARLVAANGKVARNTRGHGMPETYGCRLSHRVAIRHGRSRRASAVMVFEDDVELHPDFRKIVEALQPPDDWGVILFGCTHVETPQVISPGWVRVFNFWGTHAYAVRDRAYTPLLRVLNAPGGGKEAGTDVVFSALTSEIPMYAIYPNIAWQAEGYSDLMSIVRKVFDDDGSQLRLRQRLHPTNRKMKELISGQQIAGHAP